MKKINCEQCGYWIFEAYDEHESVILECRACGTEQPVYKQ